MLQLSFELSHHRVNATHSSLAWFLLQAVTAAEQNQLAEADKMVQVLARLSKVCQVRAAEQ